MNAAKIDVAVLILFFNRPDHLKEVFEAVRQARPARLFLYQDGPRSEKDLPGIEECRRIVEDIDWDALPDQFVLKDTEMGILDDRQMHRARRR